MVNILGFGCPKPLLFMVFGAHGFLIYTLEVERLSIKCFFRKDYCFSKGLQSTIPGDYSSNGL